MSWLAFALCGPILWAISTHLDKYLVERYFKDTDVVVLLIFTALMGLVLMPIIAWFEPGVFQRDWLSIGLMALSGLCSTWAASRSISARCRATKPRWWRRSSRARRCSAPRSPISFWARR